MRFHNQISITGASGAGSTSLVNELRKHLTDPRYRWVSAGALMRQRASELGMTIEKFAAYNRLHPEAGHDRWCDEQIAEMGRADWTICDSRLSHHFMPGAFKVLLTCNISERARRRQLDYLGKSFNDVLQAILDRDTNDRLRYLRLYPGCLWSPERFDLAIDTQRMSISDEASLLIAQHKHWQGLVMA